MRTTSVACALLLTGFAFPAVTGSSGTEGCEIHTSKDAISLGGHYVRGSLGEIWEESNGLDGLQRRDSGCIDGRILPADKCWYMGPYGLVRCTAEAVL